MTHSNDTPPADERHAGYLQLHELVRNAPDGVRRAVGNDRQRVLANGSFSLHPSMLRHLLVSAYEQGVAYSARSLAPAVVTDAQIDAAMATLDPRGLGGRNGMRDAIEAALKVRP